MKAKHQRLTLALLALAALIGAGLLSAFALRDQASYFYTPSDVAAGKAPADTPIRVGGMVVPGSIERAEDGVSVRFVVTDNTAELPIIYRGITPDLFVEGSGAVADGRLDAGGVLVADTLLAKHDENYVPRELKDMDSMAAHKSGETLKP